MRLTIAMIGAAVLAAVAGCDQFILNGGSQQAGPSSAGTRPAPPPEPPQAEYMTRSTVRPDYDTGGEGAVDMALEWSRKYAKTTEDLLQAQKTNQEQVEANKKLQAETARIQAELTQSKRELGDANEMLAQLSKELGEWKKNVLGFREEMTQAQQVQLDAIRRILVLLGGEAGGAKEGPADKQPSVPVKVSGTTISGQGAHSGGPSDEPGRG